MMDWTWLGLFDLKTPEGMKAAQEWTQQLITVIVDGGIWIVPRSGAVIRMNKKKKVAHVALAVSPDPAIVAVLESLGWTIENRSMLL